MKKILTVILAAALLLAMSTCAMAATGIGSVTTVEATAATADKVGSVSVTTTMCAVTLDENGVITGVQFDVVQPSASFDAAGAVAAEVKANPLTKAELGESYGMKGISPIGKEYNEQMEALAAWCVGKTVEEAVSMATAEGGDADLLAGCTVSISDQMVALVKAVNAAK